MTEKEFLNNNKYKISSLIKQLNPNDDAAVTDYLLDKIPAIAKKYKYNIDIEMLKDVLAEEIKVISGKEEYEEIDNYEEYENDYCSGDYYTEDTLQQYYNEISQYKLLTPEEEKEMFKKYNEGAKEIKSDIINSNLRLVVSIARRYIGKGLPMNDLIQEGNMGLMKAIDKFDYTTGNKFSTYATWWIRQSIVRGIADQSRTIRVPVHMVDEKNKFLKALNILSTELNREPTAEEISEYLNMPISRINVLYEISKDLVSLNKKINTSEEDDTELGDFVPGTDQVENNVMAGFVKVAVDNLIDESLSEREKDVIKMRFGIGYPRGYTLEEVGHKYGVTRERIRQIESKVLKRLRIRARKTGVKSYLDSE